jgi:diguanylate cyclase (GGDEF)-like protein
MKSRECNGGVQSAGCITHDGIMLFPTVKGMVIVAPQKLKKNPIPPKIDILDFIADDRIIKNELSPQVEGFELKPGIDRLEIHYTALSMLNPEKIKFKYRLIGYDDDWVDVGSRRVAYYTNLDPGNYEFRVIACNNDNVWNEEGTGIKFTLLPYFYQAGWFYLVIFIFIVLLAYILVKFRIKVLEKREQRLSELVHQRTMELEKANKKLQRLSNEDGMTKLANHRRFIEFLNSEWGRAKRNGTFITAILIDIDHFKEINDWHGHQVGDRCLQTLARKLKKVFHRPGDLVARYGGDEFIAILPETDFNGAKHLAEELRETIETSPLVIKNKGINIPMTISVGFATTIPKKNKRPDQLIKAADDALYHSKRQGRNRVNGINLEDLTLHSNLKKA